MDITAAGRARMGAVRMGWTLGTAACALLAAGRPSEAGAQESRGDAPPRTVSVGGESFVRAAPELAKIRLGVVTEARTARAASEENARKMNAVVASLRAADIPEARIQTVQLTIEPAYDYQQPEGRQVLRGFAARNVVEAEVRELQRLGDILDAAITAGGNAVEGVRFELEDPGAAQSRALEGALADARRKAEALAKAAGVKLGEVQQIAASSGGGPIPYPMLQSGVAEMAARADVAPSVSPGELTVTSNVQVTYLIE
ncbi:MAG: SIMPL domain-containing protein [Gemmatimonadetes bacterium]|nr:SIMPL domain-containing protein [Gemmatimonadota bacterium]